MRAAEDCEPTARNAAATARAETMLALAEATGIDVETLAYVGRRFEHCLGVLDAAEPAGRREVERLVARDGDELATAYKKLARAVERGGAA